MHYIMSGKEIFNEVFSSFAFIQLGIKGTIFSKILYKKSRENKIVIPPIMIYYSRPKLLNYFFFK